MDKITKDVRNLTYTYLDPVSYLKLISENPKEFDPKVCKKILEEKKLYIYHLSQTDDNGYDTYSDCVLIAESEEYARSIHPDGGIYSVESQSWRYGGSWANHPKNVIVKLVGEVTADKYTNGEVICASFHAG